MMTLLTMTILTLICATSLYIALQNGDVGAQAASWQQALSGAESAVDIAYNALNANTWTSDPAGTWMTVLYPNASPTPTPGNSWQPPTTKPSGGTIAIAKPAIGYYNYLILTPLSLQGEGSNSTQMWVTVDEPVTPTHPNGLVDGNGNVWYRIRGTGQVLAPGPKRVGNQRLDNDLRMFTMFFDRKADPNNPVDPNRARVTRTTEVVATVQTQNIWARSITLRNSITMSGGGVIDSFNSLDPTKSTGGQYDATKRQSHGDVGTTNSTGSDLNSTYVYGSLAYSGPAVKNTKNVQGTISTPFNPSIPTTSDPGATWVPTSTYSGGSPPATTFTASGTQLTPTRIKINGDFTVPGGKSVQINAGAGGYIEFWVTGKFTTSGSGFVDQKTGVHSTWYVDNDITTSGASYTNEDGYAANVSFVGVGTGHKVTVSGSGNFTGTINAPGFDITVSGSGQYMGALIGSTLNISGGAGLHYDESLASKGGPQLGVYSYGNWFDNNSNPARGITY
jgi:hypothetical protein